MVSKQMENLIKMLLNQRELEIKKRVKESREGFESMAKILKTPKDVKVERIEVDNIPSAWITVSESRDEYVILYLHGGGYNMGSLNTHLNLVSYIGRASKARVLFIEYRFAPEHRFPAGLEDAFTAYNWLIEIEKLPPSNIIIAGDSAGGGLTLATLLKIRDSGRDLPAAAVCISAATDLSFSGESIKTKAETDHITNYELFFNVFLYIGYGDPKNPLISPLFADFTGLPPLLLQVGSEEMLLDDSVRVAEKAKMQGVEVELDIWEGMCHGFQGSVGLAPEGQEAINKIGEFMLKFFK